MRKIRAIPGKIAGFLYMYFRACIAARKKGDAGKVLVIQNGHLGDALLDADAMLAITRHCLQENKAVTVLCSPPVQTMLQLIPGFEDVEIMPVASYRFVFSFSKVREILNNPLLKKGFSEVLVLHPVNLGYFLLSAGIPGEKHALVYQECFTGKRKLAYSLFKPFFSTVLLSGIDCQRIVLAETFLNQIGFEDYRAHITEIPEQQVQHLPEKPFISIVVDSSISVRRWPAEDFVQLIKLLLSRYDYDIVLLGARPEPDVTDLLSTDPEIQQGRVVDLSGQTTVAEWIEHIRQSEWIVGVDSGSIHVAASVGTTAFCLTGVFETGRYVRYPARVLLEGTKAPVRIFRKDVATLTCANCVVRTGRYGKTNKACYALCKQEKPCLCLQEIHPEDVLEAIELAYQ